MASVWETYYGGEFPRKGNAKEIGVSINAKHRIALNKAAFDLIGRPEAVVLSIIRAEHIIGLVPASLRTTGALALRESRSSSPVAYINAAKFCRTYGIVIERTERFDAPEIDNEGILRLDLKRTHDVTNWRKKRKRDNNN